VKKIAILTQRTRELKGGKKKRLWALVSKTRKDKDGRRRVLRWFGENKPPEETVAQAEKDIHYYANSADDVTGRFDINKMDFPANLDLNIEAKASITDRERKREIANFFEDMSRKKAKKKTSVSRTERAIKAASRIKRIKIEMPSGFKSWLVRRLEEEGRLAGYENKFAGAMKYLSSMPQSDQEVLKNLFLKLDGTKAEIITDSETITLDIGEHYPRQKNVKNLSPRAKEIKSLKPKINPIQLDLFD
jgi:hypothetical protein